MLLYSYNISPYSQKVAAILRYKGLEFEERFVHPLRRQELRRISGQKKVPVLVDGDRAIYDSTRIARYLDEKYPEKPIYPEDPSERALTNLLEEWADEGLPRAVVPALYFIPFNADQIFARFRSAYPAGRRTDLELAAVRQVIAAAKVRGYGEPYGLKPQISTLLNRVAEVCDYANGIVGDSGWLVSHHPTAADFALYGHLHLLTDMDGWETVRSRKKLLKIVRKLGSEDVEADASIREPDAQVLIDASKLRARKKVRA